MTYLHSNYSPTLQSICLPLPLSLQKRRLWLYHESAAHSAHLSDWSCLGFASIWASPWARHPDPFFIADCINCLCLALLGLSPPSLAGLKDSSKLSMPGHPTPFPRYFVFYPRKASMWSLLDLFFLSLDCFRLWAENQFQDAPTSHVASCQYYVQLLNTDWA